MTDIGIVFFVLRQISRHFRGKSGLIAMLIFQSKFYNRKYFLYYIDVSAIKRRFYGLMINMRLEAITYTDIKIKQNKKNTCDAL